MSNLFEEVRQLKGEFSQIRQHLHMYPELGLKEYETTKYIKEKLNEYGLETKSYGLDVGVVGFLEGAKPGPDNPDNIVALRADIDALPIKENTGLEYTSKNEGVMHACGHDGHTAILLGTAKYLSENTDKFSGTVMFIFQTGEETLKGAKMMVEAGVLKDIKPEVLVGLHCDPDLDLGQVGIKPGEFMASGDKFIIKVRGTGGHGAYPHKSYDPVVAASNVILSLQGIVSREINALESAVISVCKLEGGVAFNIIPEEVNLIGTARCYKPEIRKMINEKMQRVIEGAVSTFGCDYEFDYQYGVPAVTNEEESTFEVHKAALEVLGEGAVVEIYPRMGSEDFSVLADEVQKSSFFRLGISNPGQKRVVQHNDGFDFNDEAIPYGMGVMVKFVLNNLNK